MAVFKNGYIIFLLGVLSALAILLYFWFSPEEHTALFPKCPVYSGLGIYCTGCGSQRALHDMFHLRIGQAISHNALLIPSLLLIGYHFMMRFLGKTSILQKRNVPLLILVVVVLFTVLRNIDVGFLRYLAP
jgi:hypothetical protein